MLWILAAVLAGSAVSFIFSRRFHDVHRPAAALPLSVLACILLVRTFGDPWKIAKGFLMAESLICAGICDGISHEIPDWLMLPMLAAGFLEFQPVPSAEGFFSVSLLLYLMARATDGKAFGGGDIKLMAAAGWVLGPRGAVFGALAGMTLFLIARLVFYKQKKQYYAMAPWLGAGCFFAYLLIPIGGIP